MRPERLDDPTKRTRGIESRPLDSLNHIGRSSLKLLPGWRERLDRPDPEPDDGRAAARHILPRKTLYYASKVTLVADAGAADRLLEFVLQRPISFICFDTEFRWDCPGVKVSKWRTAQDPHSIRPLLLSLAAAEPDGEGGLTLYRFVVDLRVFDVLPVLADLFRQPIPCVAHFAHAELICLFKIGLPAPIQLWDTWACEKALHLGRNHNKYKEKQGADDADVARAREEGEEDDAYRFGLVPTCQRYGVEHAFKGCKERLQQSFLEHPADAPFSDEQLEYAAADAVAAGSLYLPQVQAATLAGALHHLVTVEMPWVETNARMHWHGVLKDKDLCHRAEEAVTKARAELQARLAEHGIANDGHAQLKQFFEEKGLLQHFRRHGKVSFDKDMLEEFQHVHPVVPVLRAIRRIDTLARSKIRP